MAMTTVLSHSHIQGSLRDHALPLHKKGTVYVSMTCNDSEHVTYFLDLEHAS